METCIVCGKLVPADSIDIHQNVCNAFSSFSESMDKFFDAILVGLENMTRKLQEFSDSQRKKDKNE